jgi:hypothetical protein
MTDGFVQRVVLVLRQWSHLSLVCSLWLCRVLVPSMGIRFDGERIDRIPSWSRPLLLDHWLGLQVGTGSMCTQTCYLCLQH